MYCQPAPLVWLVIITYVTSTLVAGQTQTITMDDQDPRIAYLPTKASWKESTDPLNFDAGGTHMLTTSYGSSATITFTFVTFHFWSPLWPYKVTTDVSVDGGAPVTLDLQDHTSDIDPGHTGATVASAIIRSWTSATNQSAEHTIVISMHPGDMYAVVDMLTFDVFPPDSITPTLTSTSTSTTISIASNTAPVVSSASVTPIILPDTLHHRPTVKTGVIVGVVGGIVLALILFGLLFYRRRRSRNGTQAPQPHPEDGDKLRYDDANDHDLIGYGHDRLPSIQSGIPNRPQQPVYSFAEYQDSIASSSVNNRYNSVPNNLNTTLPPIVLQSDPPLKEVSPPEDVKHYEETGSRLPDPNVLSQVTLPSLPKSVAMSLQTTRPQGLSQGEIWPQTLESENGEETNDRISLFVSNGSQRSTYASDNQSLPPYQLEDPSATKAVGVLANGSR